MGAYFVQSLCQEESYESFAKMEEALREGRTSFSKMDGKPSLVKDGLVFQPSCPFQETILKWKRLMGDLPPEFREVMAAYERSGEVGNSPFCIVHNTYRRLCAQKFTVDGRPLAFGYVACKSILTGRITFYERTISRHNINKDELVQLLRENMCVYKLGLEESPQP